MEDRIIRIRCDVCNEMFGCRDSDINRKFSFGSYCGEDCMNGLFRAIRENPPMDSDWEATQSEG